MPVATHIAHPSALGTLFLAGATAFVETWSSTPIKKCFNDDATKVLTRDARPRSQAARLRLRLFAAPHLGPALRCRSRGGRRDEEVMAASCGDATTEDGSKTEARRQDLRRKAEARGGRRAEWRTRVCVSHAISSDNLVSKCARTWRPAARVRSYAGHATGVGCTSSTSPRGRTCTVSTCNSTLCPRVHLRK